MIVPVRKQDFEQLRKNKIQALFIIGQEKRLPKNIPQINLGLTLAMQLKAMDVNARSEALRSLLQRNIDEMGTEVSLTHIDILFDPCWDIEDVIRQLQLSSRNHKLYVLWPGGSEKIDKAEQRLFYASTGEQDYQSFSFIDYDDVYIY